MWSEPDTVGGGGSMEKTSARVAEGSKRYVPSCSQVAAQRSSRPSSEGFSGTPGGLVKGVDMIELPYPGAAPSRHRNRHGQAPRPAHRGRGVDVRLWPDRLRPPPHRARTDEPR